MNKKPLLIAAIAFLGVAAWLVTPANAQPPFGQFQLDPIISGGSSGGSGGGSATVINASPTQVTFVDNSGTGLAGNPSLTLVTSGTTNTLTTGGLTTTGFTSLDANTNGGGLQVTGSSSLNRGMQIYDLGNAMGIIQPNGTGVTNRCLVASAACRWNFNSSGNTAKMVVYPGDGAAGVLTLGKGNNAPTAMLDNASTTRLVGFVAVGSTVSAMTPLDVYPVTSSTLAISTTTLKLATGVGGLQPFACTATVGGAIALTSASLINVCKGVSATWINVSGGAFNPW